jgi:hypothetical protein
LPAVRMAERSKAPDSSFWSSNVGVRSNAERCSAIGNSFPDVAVLRGRRLLDRSCKIAVSFHVILK